MEENKILASDFIKLNEAYLQKQTEIEQKIKKDLIENRDNYPSGAEELYCFDYCSELDPENEDKLSIIESIVNDRFKDDYYELHEIRERIVSLIGNVLPDSKESVSEN